MNTNMICPDEFIRVAGAAADAIGIVHRRYFRNAFDIEIKDDNSPVTSADRESEKLFREIIKQQFPDHGIIGEEYPPHQPDAEYIWVIDPIDGTQLFIIGDPQFALLIGLAYRGRFILGVIDHAITNERWLGADGHGTFLNQGRVHTRQCESLARAWLLRPGISRYTERREQQFKHLCDTVHTVMWGLNPYHYGLLAAGYSDIIISSGPKVHDLAPLDPIIRNAGGVVVDWNGNSLNLDSPDHILAVGDPALLDPALACIGYQFEQSPNLA